MQDVNVLVAFWSRTGATEKLALAAALGAVQAKAHIRLRWLREAAAFHEADSAPEWRENRVRMEKEYVAPREADLLWAEAIVMATPAKLRLAAPEVQSCLDLLAAVHQSGKLGCRVGAALLATTSPGEEGDSTPAALYVALARLNLIVVPQGDDSGDPLEIARLHGRRVAEVARAVKAAAL